MFSQILSFILALFVLTSHSASAAVAAHAASVKPLAKVEYSLSDRYSNSYVSNVFADNILLTLAYMDGRAKTGTKVDWKKVKSDFTYTFVLEPGKSFAFHDEELPQYKNSVVKTTNAHFDSTQGFESDGWLVGDGVCHLASFMNVVARAANLQVESPTAHNFAPIPDVPKKYGVAIYYMPGAEGSSSLQNLYITNSYKTPIAFTFVHSGNMLKIQVEKAG